MARYPIGDSDIVHVSIKEHKNYGNKSPKKYIAGWAYKASEDLRCYSGWKKMTYREYKEKFPFFTNNIFYRTDRKI